MGELTVRLWRGFAGCVAALATVSAACSPTAAEEMTLVDPQVIPANVDGRLVGCDISFHLAGDIQANVLTGRLERLCRCMLRTKCAGWGR